MVERMRNSFLPERSAERPLGSGGTGTPGTLVSESAGLSIAAVKMADCSLMLVTTYCGSPASGDRFCKVSTTFFV
jgi:hypothetical protein